MLKRRPAAKVLISLKKPLSAALYPLMIYGAEQKKLYIKYIQTILVTLKFKSWKQKQIT